MDKEERCSRTKISKYKIFNFKKE